jgi:hypothetical protein
MRELIKIDQVYRCPVCHDYFWLHFREDEKEVTPDKKLSREEAIVLSLRFPFVAEGCTCRECFIREMDSCEPRDL